VTPNIPIGDPIYDYLDLLADAGLAPGHLRGTRPITVAYAVRLVRQAGEVAARRRVPEPAFMQTLRDLIERWRPHDVGPIRLGGSAAVAAGGRDELVERPLDRDAELVGHLEPTAGGPVGAGDGMAITLTGQATGGRWSAAELSGRFDFQNGAAARLVRGYAKVGWGALELEGGRDDIVWGQGRYASMTLSGNAPAFDHVALRTSRPVRLPWIFRYLGDLQAVVFFAWMDQEAPRPGAYLIGKRMGLKPVRWLELAWTHLFAFGGKGGLSYSDSRFAEEFFLGYRRDIYTKNFANNAFSWEFRVHVPEWFELYGEHYLEDCCAYTWKRDSSFLVGARRPHLASPRDDLALEFVTTSYFAYAAGGTPEWTQGGRLTGHPLGNRGFGAYALWRYLGDGGQVLRLRIAYERRGSIDTDTMPPEFRAGAHVDLRLPLLAGRAGRVDGRVHVAVERILNARHVPGDDRFAGLGELAVEVSF
jgi:hypothetical protein